MTSSLRKKLNKKAPNLLKKPISKHSIFKFVFGVLLILYAAFVAVFGIFTFGSQEPASDITWGVTFSHSQAEALGMDWKDTHITLMDDLGVRHFRIPIYWDELQPKINDEYHFEKWDWQLDQIEERGGKAILAIGHKLPRWPECRAPEGYEDLNRASQDRELFQMLRKVVAHYRDHPAVKAWQVENEPLLDFGECPEADKDLLDAELSLVRKLDPSRPVILTDTGEFSLWYEAGTRTNVVGSTLYRIIHDPRLGFVKYWFLNPNFYARKADLLHLWNPDAKVIITELQAEPWVTTLPISENSIEEQYRTMSPEQFKKNIEFAKNTGFDTFYLWGSEWIVWLKSEGKAEIWDTADKLFTGEEKPQ